MKSEYKKIAIQAAIQSGLFIKACVGKMQHISYKGMNNLVTDTDRASERLILKKLHKAFPEHMILAEESGSVQVDSPYKWVIDPLDGTTNFAHAFPFFCVSIALEYKGDVILGVVYDPMRNELFSAEKGKSAYLNGKRIAVSRIGHLAESLVATGFSYSRKKRAENVKYFRKFLMRCQAVRRAGSAALDLCYVACGRFEGFWETNLSPWDSAAGFLIVKEAGGMVTKFDGSTYTPYEKEVLASNGHVHKTMRRILADQ